MPLADWLGAQLMFDVGAECAERMFEMSGKKERQQRRERGPVG